MKTQEMKTQHTPGPWFVGSRNDALYIIDKAPTQGAPQKLIASLAATDFRVHEEANAALIASAPALYEALKGLQDEVGICYADSACIKVEFLEEQFPDSLVGKCIRNIQEHSKRAMELIASALASATPQGEGR